MKIIFDKKLSLLAMTVSLSLGASYSLADEFDTVNGGESVIGAKSNSLITPIAGADNDSLVDGGLDERRRPIPCLQRTSSSEVIIGLPDERCDYPGPPRPTPIKPGAPGMLIAHHNDGDIEVGLTWKGPRNRGNGHNFKYEVYQTESNGDASLIYTGTKQSFKHPIGQDKFVKFSVKACSSAGCSDVEETSFLAFNSSPSADDTETVPFERLRVGSNANGKTTGDQTNEEQNALAVLGNGYDDIKAQALGSHCWDTSGEDKIASVEGIGEGFYTGTVSTEYEELRRVLGRNTSFGASIAIGGFGAGFSGGIGTLNRLNAVSVKSAIAGSYLFVQNQYNAHPASTLGLKTVNSDQLRAERKKEFRKECGDKYVDSVKTGAKFQFTIQLDQQDVSYQDTRSRSIDLDLRLRNVLSDGIISNSEIQSLRTDFGRYNFKIWVYHIGFTDNDKGVSVNFGDIGAFAEAMKLVIDRDVDNAVVIDSTQRDYPIPDGLGDEHFEVFADYTPYYDRFNNWALLDQQLLARCHMLNPEFYPDGPEDSSDPKIKLQWEVYNKQRNMVEENTANMRKALPSAGDQFQRCITAKNIIERFRKKCVDQGQWSQCFAPEQPECIDSNLGDKQCMEAPNKVVAKYVERAYGYMDAYKRCGALGPCTGTNEIEVCFANSQTVPDLFKIGVDSMHGYNPDPEKALTIQVVSVKGRIGDFRDSNVLLPQVSGQRTCLKSWAKVVSRGFSSAHYRANLDLHGYFLTPQEYDL